LVDGLGIVVDNDVRVVGGVCIQSKICTGSGAIIVDQVVGFVLRLEAVFPVIANHGGVT